MTVDEVRCDVEPWLPVLASLIAEQDTMVTTGRTKPGSKPPWNTEVANTLFDAIATIADVRAELAQAVHGRIPERLPYRQTGRALKEIGNLSHGVDEDLAGEAAWQIDAIITRIRQLPAIDQEEKPRRIRSACPFCGLGMLRLMPMSGKVTCLRVGACFNTAGKHPHGELVAYQDGTAAIFWNDDTVT